MLSFLDNLKALENGLTTRNVGRVDFIWYQVKYGSVSLYVLLQLENYLLLLPERTTKNSKVVISMWNAESVVIIEK